MTARGLLAADRPAAAHRIELELRLPDADDLLALAALAEAGVHDPAEQPFKVQWTDVAPVERARSTMRYHWSCWGSWQPADWTLNLVVVRDGVVVGTQGMGGQTSRRSGKSGPGPGSAWSTRARGSAPRCARPCWRWPSTDSEREFAVSAAFAGNPASLAVSRKLGYADDGFDRHLIRGEPVQSRALPAGPGDLAREPEN